MKRISKELAERMVVDVLVQLSKRDDVPSEFAKNSMDIMNDEVDNSIFTGILLSKAKPSFCNDDELNMKFTILASLQTIISFADKNKNFVFNDDLAKEFSTDNTDKCSNSTKLDFALNQFVSAFFEYERLEKKYPELMKIM